MRRRTVLLFFSVLIGCGGQRDSSAETVLSSELSGGWKRGSLKTPATSAPDLIEKLGVDSSAEAEYQGAGRVLVRVYRMRSETSAFEAMQKWRQTDSLGLQKGRFFVTATGESPQANMAVLSALQKGAS